MVGLPVRSRADSTTCFRLQAEQLREKGTAGECLAKNLTGGEVAHEYKTRHTVHDVVQGEGASQARSLYDGQSAEGAGNLPKMFGYLCRQAVVLR